MWHLGIGLILDVHDHMNEIIALFAAKIEPRSAVTDLHECGNMPRILFEERLKRES